MIKVHLTSTETNKADILLNSVEFPIAPNIDDYIDVLTFVDLGSKQKVLEHFKSIGKITLGKVSSKVWTNKDSSVELMLMIDFEDDEDPEGNNNPALSEGFFH